MKHSLLLLKTLLLSTSQRNIFRHSDDKKKRRRIVLGFMGKGILYAVIMLYCIFMCIGYGYYGMAEAVPVLCALTVSLIAFIFTLFRTNGYLFAFKEYDMLMSLPFAAKTVAGCKFLYMYIKMLPWYFSISTAMLIGYGVFAHPSAAVYPLWLLLSFVLPLINQYCANRVNNSLCARVFWLALCA